MMKMNDNQWIGLTFAASMLIAASIQFGFESPECAYDKIEKANVCERVIGDGKPITGSTLKLIDPNKTFYWTEHHEEKK